MTIMPLLYLWVQLASRLSWKRAKEALLSECGGCDFDAPASQPLRLIKIALLARRLRQKSNIQLLMQNVPLEISNLTSTYLPTHAQELHARATTIETGLSWSSIHLTGT